MSPMLEHALDYAARGWPVFPCNPSPTKPKSKTPLTPNGFKDASTDPAVITTWWSRWPTALIGARMGRAAGVFAIDPDVVKEPGDADGLAAWEALVAEHGGIPHTHTHESPSGGRHVLFRWRDDRPITNKEGLLKGTGINVRGEGGYVIAPPSVMADGRAYRIAESFDFFNFAEPPEWLLKMIETQPTKGADLGPYLDEPRSERSASHDCYVAAALENECRIVAGTRSGGRNNALNTAAFNLGTLVGANVLDSGLAVARLLEAAKASGLLGDDGLRAARATIESGMTRGAERPRKLTEARRPRERQARTSNDNSEPAGMGDNDHILLMEDAAALQFAAQHKNRLRYCHDHGAWFEWTGSHWKKNATGLAFHWARTLARQLARDEDDKTRVTVGKAAFANSVERFAKSDPAFAVTSEHWDQDAFLLGTPGGTVDLKTGELRPAKPTDGITKVTGTIPAETADCPLWLRFLDQTSGGDVEMIRFMQQWSGYALTGDTREHALVFVFGDGGNGKSVFVNVLTGIMAAYSTTAAMDTFIASHGDKHSTDLAMLRGARLVTASETEEGRQWAESRIKQMTGGDLITARFMRQDNFTFRPSFKLTIIGNHKPGLKSVDAAARRRFNLVPFTRKPASPDRQLEEKLKAEWPGILRWMIEGCLDWQTNGLVRPASVIEATETYFDEQDVMAEWLAEKCVVDRTNTSRKETTQDLFASWSVFAKANNEVSGTVRAFAQKLQKLGFEQSRTVPTFGGARVRGFVGITVRYDASAHHE